MNPKFQKIFTVDPYKEMNQNIPGEVCNLEKGKWVQSNRKIWFELSKNLICLRDNTHSCKLLEFDETKILPLNYNGKPSTGDWYRSETTGKWVKKTNDME